MMNPDIHDKAWLELREAQWQRYVEGVSDERSPEELKYIRRLFFEAEFEYGNTQKYGVFAFDYTRAFLFCPIQTKERWEKWFNEYLPEWLGDKFDSELLDLMFRFGFFGKHRTWTVETLTEIFKFCFDERISYGPYSFLEYAFPKHPFFIKSHNLLDFYKRWLSNLVGWLNGRNFDSGCISVGLMDMWVSVLHLIHPVYFSYAINQDTIIDQSNLQKLIQIGIEDYSFEKHLISSGVDESDIAILVQNDNGNRKHFLDCFCKKLDSADIPNELAALWKAAKLNGMVPAKEMKPSVCMDIDEEVRRMDINKWIKKRIEQF